jgi:outer membrane receptor protein involved in Fe transport
MSTSKTLTLGRAAPASMAALLASTCLMGMPVRADAATAAAAGGATEVGEIIVTAEKRTENLQKVPMSIQAIDTRKLTELNITNFQDYVKFMPSVSFQTFGPNQTSVYMRGVASGDNANHSGPLPSVGTYLDEQAITTIGGTLDVHIYDIARVEVLPGPQGTLYGASSEAGTMRIITNKPTTDGIYGAINLEGNTVDHGSQGYVAEGFINIPITSRAAVRLVAFDEHDAGFIDNVLGVRPFVTADSIISNAGLTKRNFNPVDTFGGRATLKFDINDNWTIEPSIIAQDTKAPGVLAFNPAVGDLQVNRFQPDTYHDRWYLTSLTINGKIGRFDLTYSGGYFHRWLDTQTDYTDYSVAYDQYFGSGAYWVDNNGEPLARPMQRIVGRDRFEKGSNELRIASPASDRLRFIAGLFQERQSHWIIQDYQIQGFSDYYSVTGWPGTIWLTDQYRIDRDRAVFGEASFDITPKLTITGGLRWYHYDNSLHGFFGFSANYSSHTGEVNCIPGLTFKDAPCVDLNREVTGSGETHKVNLTYHLDSDKLVYFTYSTGYRPGGVNRVSSSSIGPYGPDHLTNYEVGFKSSWLDRSLVFDVAVYDEVWNQFQFSFLGLNSLTVVENAPSARVLGAEGNLDWRPSRQLTLSAGAAYDDGKLSSNFCGADPATGEIIQSCPDAQAQAVKGQQLPFTPKFKGHVTARYTFPFMGWDAHAQASVLYQSSEPVALRTNDPFPAGANDVAILGSIPAYATVDLSLGADHGKTSVELFVKNALDERGELGRYTPCTTGICGVGYPPANGLPGAPPALYVVPIQPLTVGIRVGQKF